MKKKIFFHWKYPEKSILGFFSVLASVLATDPCFYFLLIANCPAKE